MSKLTPKQEAFCLKFTECNNASEAYRFAYDCGKMKTETINNNAYVLFYNNDIAARIAELKAELKAKSDIKKEDKINLLNEMLNVSIADYYKNGKIKNFDELTVAQNKCIKTYQVETIKGCTNTKLELYDKLQIIQIHNKMLGDDAPTRQELTGRDGAPINIEPLTIEIIDSRKQTDGNDSNDTDI